MLKFCAREELHAHVLLNRCTSRNTLYKSASRIAAFPSFVDSDDKFEVIHADDAATDNLA